MKDPRFAKFVVFVNAAVPLALLCWDAYQHDLGANPVNFSLRTTGMLGLIFLLLSLAVTPLRKISGKNWLSHFRKMLGLYGFFYICLHFVIYFWLERSLDLSGTLSDVRAWPFILVGMAGLLMLIPLAITSTNGMIKRMGAKRWKQLHRLAYLAAIAGVIHYWMLVKADIRQPVALGVTLAILLGYRIYAAGWPALKKRFGLAGGV